MRIPTQKTIADREIHGLIDIRPVLPLVDTPEFQSLGYKYQLGITHIVFPSATHTRKAHSLGAYEGTKKLCRGWLELGMITKREADALCAYALCHDIGHYTFSHLSEVFVKTSHKQRGIDIMQKHRRAVEQCGVDFELFMSLMKHENPLYLAVSDKNLGMEKLDYLDRDGRVTIGRPGGVQYLRPHIYWVKNQLVIDERAVDEAKKIQDFYVQMFKGVYLIKAGLIAQRGLQRMIYLLLQSKEMSLEEFANANDYELLGRFASVKSPKLQKLYQAFKERDLFTEAVVLRYHDFAHVERTASKKIAVFGLEDSLMEKITTSPLLSDYNQKALIALETKIAKALKLQPEDVLIVTVVSPERFKTEDISILASNGKIASLKERYPNHFSDLGETARAYTALRICSKRIHREKLAKNAELIKEIILDSIS